VTHDCFPYLHSLSRAPICTSCKGSKSALTNSNKTAVVSGLEVSSSTQVSRSDFHTT